MSLKIKKIINIFVKADRSLAFPYLLLLALLLAGYLSVHNIKAQSLPSCQGYVDANSILNTATPPNKCSPVSCSSLTASTAKTPDSTSGYNCYYAPLGIPLPPCKTFGFAKNPRGNCADIIDLPLCDTFSNTNTDSPFHGSKAMQGINCVKECAEDEIGEHNKSCINFIKENRANSVSKKCYQLGRLGGSMIFPSTSPSSNCDASIKCNLLTAGELAYNRQGMMNSDYAYCDGDVKCYEFFNNTANNQNNSANLQYIPPSRSKNTICKIHNCEINSDECKIVQYGNVNLSDIEKIQGKDALYQGHYKKYINMNQELDQGLCSPLDCKIVTYRQYSCDADGNNALTKLNINCDAQCKIINTADSAMCIIHEGNQNQICNNSICVKKIDCNNSENNSQPECQAATPETSDNSNDIFKAWLYRPTPLGDMVDRSKSSILKANGLCYKFENLQDWSLTHDDKPWEIFGDYSKYSHRYFSDPTLSPGMCNLDHLGSRGIGYMSISGINGNSVDNKPNQKAGYIKGFVGADYSGEQPKYKITACLRFQNAGQLEVSGERECRVAAEKWPGTGLTMTQWCGFDICRDMEIDLGSDPITKKSKVDDCSFTTFMEDHKYADHTMRIMEYRPDPNRQGASLLKIEHKCFSTNIDNDIRMRARKYGRRICVFIDHYEHVAHNRKNYNGSEKLADGTCIEGTKDGNGKCNGFDTNTDPEFGQRWRTSAMIKYISNNQSSGNKPGYFDADGQFFPEQECAKIPLRIGPPKLYMIATVSNSNNLFEPPLFIAQTLGGLTSLTTNFNEPDVIVQFGNGQAELKLPSCDVSNTDICTTSQTTDIKTIKYTASVYIKKEYDNTNNQGIVCLYRRITNLANGISEDIKIDCANRDDPTI